MTFISLTFMRNFLCRFRHIEGIALCELCCTMHAVAAPIIFWAHKNWLHYSKMGFPIVPTISPSYLSILVDFWAASWCQEGQQSILQYGKKVGWLLCFAMFFLPNYLVGNSRPVLLSSVTPPPWLSKPHTPRPTPRSPGLNPTTRKRSRAIDHASGENRKFFILSII